MIPAVIWLCTVLYGAQFCRKVPLNNTLRTESPSIFLGKIEATLLAGYLNNGTLGDEEELL